MKTKFSQIVFMQGHEANEALEILNEKGPKSAVEYLAQWDMGEDYDVREKSSRGTGPVWRENDYIMTFSQSYEYIGLERMITVEKEN